MVSRKARPRRRSIGEDSTTVPPSHERCTRRNNDTWRCPKKRKDGSRHCQEHYDYYQCHGKKKKAVVVKRSSGPGLFLSDQTPTDAKLRLSSLDKKTELKIKMESYICAATAREQLESLSKKVKQESQSFIETLDEVHLEVELQKANEKEKELGDQKQLLEEQMATTDERYVSLESEPEETSNSLLSETLSISAECERQLRSLEDIHQKFRSSATSATEKSIRIKVSDAATSEGRSQLREIEMKLISSEQKNIELEQKVTALLDLNQRSHSLTASVTEKCIQLEDTVHYLDAATLEARSHLREIERKLMSTEQKNVELELRLSTLEDINQRAHSLAASATEKCITLEDICRSVDADIQEARSQLKEIEIKLISTEQKNVELEQKLAKVELNEEWAAGQRSHCWC